MDKSKLTDEILKVATVYGFRKVKVDNYPDDILYLISERYDDLMIHTNEHVLNIVHQNEFNQKLVEKLTKLFHLKTPMEFFIEIFGKNIVEQIINTTDYKYVALEYSERRARKYFMLSTNQGAQLIDDVDIDYTKKLISYDFGISSFHSGLVKLYKIFDGLGYEVDAENAVGLDDEGQDISDWWENESN